jgi:hypothetical protein
VLKCKRNIKSAGTVLAEKVNEEDHMDDIGVDGITTSQLVLRILWCENADWID